MRKYLQLIVVLAIFFSAVLVRHLREPAEQPSLGEGSAIHAPASPLASPQPTATQTMAPAETSTTPQLTPTVATALAVGTTAIVTGQTTEATPTPTATPTTTPTLTPRPTVTTWPYLFEGSVFKDGAFTGKPDRMTYGDLQVTVVMRGGRIEDVLLIEIPARTPTSEKMSEEMLPRLVAQALTKQDWDVDTISGATQTTIAFKRAMVYALRQAEQG